MPSDWPDLYSSEHPLYHDPRFQRRIVEVHRPIPFVENVHEAILECGHEPLLLGGNHEPEVGECVFCPSCAEKGANE